MKYSNSSEKAHYPFTYGDKNADEVMLSDYIVELMGTKRFQSHVTSMVFALLTLASYSHSTLAIWPEYVEAVANVAQNIEHGVLPLGDIVGNTNVGNNAAKIGHAGRVGLNQPVNGPKMNPLGQNGISIHKPGQVIKPSALRIPGPQMSAAGQYTNKAMIIGSISSICLNGAWGKPILGW